MDDSRTARRGLVTETVIAERELLGQLLTFCAFLGGLSLAALVELFSLEPASPAVVQLVGYAQVVLALTSVCALIGAFFALLGAIHYRRLVERLSILRLRRELDRNTVSLVDAMTHTYANAVVFRQMARLLAVIAMATALVSVVLVSMLLSTWIALGLMGVALFILIGPMIAVQVFKLRLASVPPDQWLQGMAVDTDDPHEVDPQDTPSGTVAAQRAELPADPKEGEA